ncbi:superoxide dismutase family protein [Ammoniphilus resinae]|uniref:Cu-Zn family superoxide dismutase n=1 Tax=Ammoniphilus resinae TaxID=861532 RepID=A0ABS4GXB8_9BACL|nr:superoxide dismutase family protein [Ammoniphilus resinae]MBP1934925.1 Cu-Zn family superoxide dismutase [Ammoniphilus resinae]
MNKFAFLGLNLMLGIALMTGTGFADGDGQQDNANTNPPSVNNNGYNYTQTYFTSNDKQHKFVTTYLELKNKEGEVIGVAGLVQMGKHVIIKVNASGLNTGKHGFHIHEKQFANNDFTTAGGHFNPTGKQHGHENPNGAHLGDLPDLIADEEGRVDQAFILEGVSLEQGGKNNSILGRSLIIHANEDDGESDPAGKSGERIAGGNLPN